MNQTNACLRVAPSLRFRLSLLSVVVYKLRYVTLKTRVRAVSKQSHMTNTYQSTLNNRYN